MREFENYECVVGLECHVQLCTRSKLFSQAPNRYAAAPNTLLQEVDAGLPGSLPTLNAQVVDFALRLGFALQCDIQQTSEFARKHYFYPDLPKGYQISQYDRPICFSGRLPFTRKDGSGGQVMLQRIHIEEDAGKNLHSQDSPLSYVDYNRAGAALLEVVTEPQLHSVDDAMQAVKSLRSIVMYLGICDGNMQEGSLRADVNISVRKKGCKQMGTRTEIKNLNSIRFMGQAIAYESRRQILQLQEGKSIQHETRAWDDNRKETRSLRSKEQQHDYRYFPDPDLPVLHVSNTQLQHIQKTLPELPGQKKQRLCQALGLSAYDAQLLTADKALVDYFEEALRVHNNPKALANWILNEVLRVVKEQTSTEPEAATGFTPPLSADNLGQLVKLLDDGSISTPIAKQVFEELLQHPKQTPLQIVQQKGWHVQRDTQQLQQIIQQVLQDCPTEVNKYLAGKTRLFGHMMGQVMRLSKGQADPKQARDCLQAALDKLQRNPQA
ncbi:MAG: Asp-tRNA(Asn)/Glu-tRNA(Gln) amidotransferase subunit GatB [Myxococcota bacterium]